MFTSFNLLGMEFKNRILASPMLSNQANTDGTINAELIRHYLSLARQGVGMIIVESAYVARQGRAHVTQLGISDEEHLDGLEKLIKGMKKEGCVAGIRLVHSGAKTSEEICGEQPVGPSVISFGKDYDTSREFDEGDCEEIRLFFTHAAERAEEVGFDFIEINASQNWLLDQCMLTRFNNRDDDYGIQSMPTRLKLTTDIIQSIKQRVSKKMPISYYFTVHDKLEDNYTLEDLEAMITILANSGVDIFHPVTIHVMNKFLETDQSFLEWLSGRTKQCLLAEGNIKSPQVLKDIYALKIAQFYAIDRTLFSRPQWYQFLRKKMLTM
ncbi:MAG: NADH:flavin oxidoreductase [SAR324 cluster bacterium]|nr:NADH:flavin oxidoreductase [SAR324 cluster bacterium]